MITIRFCLTAVVSGVKQRTYSTSSFFCTGFPF